MTDAILNAKSGYELALAFLTIFVSAIAFGVHVYIKQQKDRDDREAAYLDKFDQITKEHAVVINAIHEANSERVERLIETQRCTVLSALDKLIGVIGELHRALEKREVREMRL